MTLFQNKKSKLILGIIFLLAISFRLVLAFVNDGSSNDDHGEVANLITRHGKLPDPKACWQCYHPKLYHYSVSKLCALFQLNDKVPRDRLAQLINAFAGILTLLLIWKFISQQRFRDDVKLISFALIALNPRLIAIHSQISNDAFIILFGSLIIYSLYQFIDKGDKKHFFSLLFFSVLAGLTKTSSSILFIGVILVLLCKVIQSKKYSLDFRKGFLTSLFIYVIVYLGSLALLGEYRSTYKKYQTFVVYNSPIYDPPNLLTKTTYRRAGIQSIVEGYFTFRIIDLIQNPKISNDEKEYPKHRTSIWSQLYGRCHFIYFDNWPPNKWQSDNPKILNVGRLALFLALLPLAFLIIGLIHYIKICYRQLFKKNENKKQKHEWIFSIFMLGFISFIILFTALGRDFSFMKIIYLFPGILAFVLPLLMGCKLALSYLENNRLALSLSYTWICILMLTYLIPIVDLMSKLTA